MSLSQGLECKCLKVVSKWSLLQWGCGSETFNAEVFHFFVERFLFLATAWSAPTSLSFLANLLFVVEAANELEHFVEDFNEDCTKLWTWPKWKMLDVTKMFFSGQRWLAVCFPPDPWLHLVCSCRFVLSLSLLPFTRILEFSLVRVPRWHPTALPRQVNHFVDEVQILVLQAWWF